MTLYTRTNTGTTSQGENEMPLNFLPGHKKCLIMWICANRYNRQNRIDCINRFQLMKFNRSPVTTGSHTFLVVTLCNASQATHAFLGMLPLTSKSNIKMNMCVIISAFNGFHHSYIIHAIHCTLILFLCYYHYWDIEYKAKQKVDRRMDRQTLSIPSIKVELLWNFAKYWVGLISCFMDWCCKILWAQSVQYLSTVFHIYLLYWPYEVNEWNGLFEASLQLHMTVFLKTVGSIGFSDKKSFGPTGRRSKFHSLVW